jgi:hypothetical protein
MILIRGHFGWGGAVAFSKTGGRSSDAASNRIPSRKMFFIRRNFNPHIPMLPFYFSKMLVDIELASAFKSWKDFEKDEDGRMNRRASLRPQRWGSCTLQPSRRRPSTEQFRQPLDI